MSFMLFIRKVYGRFTGPFCYRRYKFYTASPANRGVLLEIDGFQFLELSESDLHDTPMCCEEGRMDRFLKRMQDGYKCYGHKDMGTGRLCSYFWVCDDAVVKHVPFVFGCTMRLPKDTAYISDCRVSEDYRGQKLYTSGLIEMMSLFTDKRFLITAEAKNDASHRGVLAAGYSCIGGAGFLKIGGIRRVVFSDLFSENIDIHNNLHIK